MTLFRTVEPFFDESLPGLIARAAAINVYPRSLDVLVQAGDSGLRPEAVAVRENEFSSALAEVLGADEQRIKRMFHRPVLGTTSIDFFGVKLRAKLREPRLRRVSPMRLSGDSVPFVRAVWHVRPLTFDPATKELLVSHCPACGEGLGFTVTKGIAICEHCEFDLRHHRNGLVQIDDMEALDFAAGMIDPANSVRNLRHIGEAVIDELNRGQLFELVVALASALMMNAGASREVKRQNASRGGITHLEPTQLARAARAILAWPQGFVDMCRQEADQLHLRDMRYGVVKELGAIALLGKDELLDGFGKEAVTAGIKNYLTLTTARQGIPRPADSRLNNEFAGTKDLIKQHGVDQVIVRSLAKNPRVWSIRSEESISSPYMLLRFQADGILQRYKDLRSEDSITYELGIPPCAVRDLADRGFLEAGAGIENTLRASHFNYRASGFEYVFGYLRDVLPVTGRKPGYIPFAEAMLMFPAGKQPWAPLIEDILLGIVPAVFHRKPTAKALFAAISVHSASFDWDDLAQRQAAFRPREIERVPILVANLILGVRKYEVFQACVDADLLHPDEKKTLAYAEVMQFARDYILTAEISVRAQRDAKGVGLWLRVHRILPKLEIPGRGGVYRRALVEPLFMECQTSLKNT